LLALLWWSWGGFTWLTNTQDPDSIPVRLIVFGAMAAMLVVSIAVPGAFGDDATVFAGAYVLVRLVHIAAFVQVAPDAEMTGVVRRMGVRSAPALLLVLLGAVVGGDMQVVPWVGAALFDYGSVLGMGEGWRVHPGHFAERHGLIVIIAIGESIVGAGATRTCTSRWWRGSSSSRSASRRRSPTSASPSTWSPRSGSRADSRSTCSLTSRSGCATCAR